MIWLDKTAKWDFDYNEKDVYSSINKIGDIKCKMFIIHGKRDKTIDVRHSYLLYERYNNTALDNNQIWLVVAEGAGHNDIQFLIEDYTGPFFKRIQKFIETVKMGVLPIKESAKNAKNIALQNKREEVKAFFYLKEVKSLALSYKRMLINICEKEDNEVMKNLNSYMVNKKVNFDKFSQTKSLSMTDDILDIDCFSREVNDAERPTHNDLINIYAQNTKKNYFSYNNKPETTIQLYDEIDKIIIHNYY